MNVLASPFMEGITEITKVAAETKVSAARVLYVEGKGDPEKIRAIDRRHFKFSPYEPTGLYASPNEKIIIQVEGTQNIQAYIGTFSYDGAWNQDSLVKSFTLKPGENTIESLNGGMIYFYNPQQGGTVKTEIKTGGTTTPLFELGKHTQQDLVDMLDKYPDTHAVELKGERVLITASPARVKKYLIDSNTDPVQLLKKLDESISIQDRVSGLSEKESDKHYVHFVEDNHSTGYMYSYYGRTAYIGDAIQHVLNVKDFTENGWGPWHEAGHQRQQLPWTWDGLGEVTVNIYSMSVQRAFGNKSRLESGTYDKAFTYLNKPQSEKDYNKIDDVFVKLVMFWQLDLAFGEEFYPKLHQLYRAIPNEELPKSSDEKIQDFIYNTSKVTQKNLLPFFDKWGLIATPETRQKIENLNYPLLAAPIWEAIDSKPVIVEENEQTPDMEPNLTVPVGATIKVGDSFAPMVGVAATDKEDGDLTDKVTVDGKVDTTKPGTYVLTYTVKDSAGHLATQTQTVTVKEKEKTVEDQEPELTVPEEAIITAGDKFDPMSRIKAIDKEDGAITDKVIHFGEVDTSKTGTYEVKFLVRDSGGNEVTTIQKVVVKDKDNGNGNNGSGNNNDSDNNNTNNGNGNSNISNNSTSDKKEDTYKELPKTGTSTNNSAAMGILMVFAGMVLTFGRKFRKVLK
ncbi:S-layer protein [Bacillus toyonensis]|uniref:M60 family metallopeptidase n=1 Tax=Bacillus toyonensis TaxID=155322 RepID=UPI000BF14E9F|nr:M60 family metallopeptidase [Bacillus toyonensis]PEP14113.1 S-layer protein [Bacillus toyonensis]